MLRIFRKKFIKRKILFKKKILSRKVFRKPLKIKIKLKKRKFRSLWEKLRYKFSNEHNLKISQWNYVNLTRFEKRKQSRRYFKKIRRICFIMLSLLLIFCYDVFEDYEFLFLYQFHKWW